MFNTNIPIRSQSVNEDNYSSSSSSSFYQELYWKAHTEWSLTVFTELSDHYGTFLLFFTSIYFDRELFTWNEELFSHKQWSRNINQSPVVCAVIVVEDRNYPRRH